VSTEQQEDVGASSYYAAYPLHNESERLMVEIGGVNNSASERYKPTTTATAPAARRKSVSFDEGGDKVHEIPGGVGGVRQQQRHDDDDDNDHDEHRRGRSGP